MKKQSGFTLIELAIVLVIIGLLLGGVLKGQELITQARIKNVINDMNSVTVAFQGYRDRYRATPGDDLGATRWAGAIAGNGDNTIAGTYNAQIAVPTAADESNLFWDHLRRAGFVTGTGGLAPNNSVGGLMGIQTGNGAGGTALASTSGTPSTGFGVPIVCVSNIPDKIAIAIDTTQDDGSIQTGTIRGFLHTAAMAGNTAPAIPVDADDVAGGQPDYVENGVNVYTICKPI